MSVPMNGIVVRPVHISDERAFMKAMEECALDVMPYTFAFNFGHSHDFAGYVQLLQDWSKGLNLPERFVPNTFLVAVVGDTIVGRISIRHELNEFLASVGGHVGYVIVPSQRKKGYGTLILSLAKPYMLALGLSSCLVTCDEDNTASLKIIESNGGVLDNIVYDAETMKYKRRYWITLV